MNVKMALKYATELQQFILERVERTGKILGSGSFGSVEEMSYDHAPCAGKIIHEMLVDSHNIGAAQLITKFEQECKLLKELRYPHIVQFMGLCFFDNCKSPVIVMELLNSNVGQWINSSQKELPLSLKSSILRDTAKGLYHLHSHDPQIIHRDLTARNVLLTKSMRAKIADLGNAYIVPPQHLTKMMTRVPGTVPYMPPEAFHPNFPYSEMLDMFSFGHLALYIMIQEELYDHLLPPTYADPKSPGKVLGRSEIERRQTYLDKLHKKFASGHDMSSLIQQCLNNNPQLRPSASRVICIFDDMLKEHCDDYLLYDDMNRYDIAQKLREVQDNRGFDDSGATSKDKKVIGVKENVMKGEKFILQMFRKKPGKFRKGAPKWRQYTFCYTSGQLQYYTDLDKAPIQATDTAKIESVERLDGDCIFKLQFKGNDEWTLKARCEEETLGWMQALKPLIQKRAPPTALPAPPPPPPIQDADRNYESLDNFTQQSNKHVVSAFYEEIKVESRDAPATYAASPRLHQQKQKKEIPEIMKQEDEHYRKLVGPPHPANEVIQVPTPQIIAECIDQGQSEASAQGPKKKLRHPERRISKKYSAEQLDKVLEIMQVMQLEATSKPKPEELYDDIATCNTPESVPVSDHRREWGVGTDNYVDMNEIDHTYDIIPGSPKQNFYFNIDDKPPLPPKMPVGPKLQPKAKPALLSKPDMFKPGKSSSFDEVMLASSKVSTDMLVLYDDDDEEDLYVQNTFKHRPDWAKASMTVVSHTELDKYGLEDEMLNLLTLDASHLRNPEAFASGQFGDVYRATLETSEGEGVEVAIKSVKHATPKEKQNFVREMCVMSRMLHPNIVRLYGLVLKANLIVLEYMHHGDLGTFLKENDRPVSKLILYMMDIGLGMHHISSLGLVHRDLAARNILVGLNETCKVADFGLLRAIDDGCYLLTGASKVPIRWCAPECLTTQKYYPASDVWSYGIVLWEMACPTVLPYKEYHDYHVASKIIDGERMGIPYRYPEIVQKIMKACWRYNPERRPSFQYITMLLTKLTFNK